MASAPGITLKGIGEGFASTRKLANDACTQMKACIENCKSPMVRLDADRTQLPQSVSLVKAGLSDMAALVAEVRTDLENVQSQLDSGASKAIGDSNQRLEALERGAKEVETRIGALTQSVQATMSDLQTRAADLLAGASALSGAGVAGEQTLRDAYQPANAALEADQGVRALYNPDIFNDLALALNTLQKRIDLDTSERVPQAINKLSAELVGAHTSAVQASLKAFGIAGNNTHSDFTSHSQKDATKMREEHRTGIGLAEALAGHELPLWAKDVTDKQSEPEVRAMLDEAAKLKLLVGNMAAHLNKEQSQALHRAVSALHLALKSIVSR